MSDIDGQFDAVFQEHLEVAAGSRETLAGAFAEVVAACETALGGGGKLLFFGNGGSAADAQHIATEFVVKLGQDRAPMAAIALTTDTSALTAAGNDYGFERIFSRQVAALGRAGDAAIGISTSGESANVLQAMATAREMGLKTIALTGATGGKLAGLCDHCLKVPSTTTNRIQEIHITLLHALCGTLERRLGLV